MGKAQVGRLKLLTLFTLSSFVSCCIPKTKRANLRLNHNMLSFTGIQSHVIDAVEWLRQEEEYGYVYCVAFMTLWIVLMLPASIGKQSNRIPRDQPHHRLSLRFTTLLLT